MWPRLFLSILLLAACLSSSRALGQNSQIQDDQAEIAKLLEQALHTTEPEEQIALYEKILQIDPNNQNAFNGIKEAQQKIDQRNKEREKKEADRQAQAQQEAQHSEAVRNADQAVASGNLPAARSALDTLRRIAPLDPNLARIDSDVQSLASYRNMVWIGSGAAMALFAGGLAAALLYLRRRNTPYLEVIQGSEPGRRYLLEKEVTLVGSIDKFEDLPNDIVLKDEDGRVAKAHCEIHKKDKKLYVIDSYSKEGTFVDGHKVDPPEKPVRLRSGSNLSIGGAEVLKVGFARKKT